MLDKLNIKVMVSEPVLSEAEGNHLPHLRLILKYPSLKAYHTVVFSARDDITHK